MNTRGRNSVAVVTWIGVALGALTCCLVAVGALGLGRRLEACPPPPSPCAITVGWEGLSEGCPKNGGYRVWVGKSSPSDPSSHDEYTVKAVTRPGVNVYFRAWDPDDPSSDTGPVDPNDPELGRSAGQDNRRVPHTYLEGQWTSSEGGNTTIVRRADATGVARAMLRVTPRPGDNFMVTASCDTDKVSAITQEQFDRRDFPPGVAVSQMLTVWRKLHINFSSFPNDVGHKNEAEDGNWVQFDAVWYEPEWNATGFEVNDFDEWDEEDDHFNNGVIRIWHKDRGEYGHTVLETCIHHAPWKEDEYVYIAGNHTDKYDRSCFYRLADDDNYNNDALSLKVSYPRKPDCSELDAALEDCYMQYVPYPLTVRAGFDENVYDNELSGYITDPAHYSLHPAISDYFFTTHVVSAHQDAPRPPRGGADRDPGPGEGGHYTGGTPEAAVLGAAIPTDHGQCIYLEPIREFLASQSNIERAVLIHEIGHCCGASHDIGNLRVMEQFARNIEVVRFADKAKDEIRWKVWPPGGPTDKIYNSPTP